MDLPLQELPGHGPCFICGPENPNGMNLVFLGMEDGSVEARFSYSQGQQGPPGHAHGGAIAAVMDEVMGAAVWRAGHPVLLAHFELDYKRPVPLGELVRVAGRVVEVKGKKVLAQGELLLHDGQVATRSKGLFIHAPRMFGDQELWKRIPTGA